jgi:hypothetical protein
MDINQLEYQLNKGNNFGFNLEKSGLVSWVILSKQKPVNRFLNYLSGLTTLSYMIIRC